MTGRSAPDTRLPRRTPRAVDRGVEPAEGDAGRKTYRDSMLLPCLVVFGRTLWCTLSSLISLHPSSFVVLVMLSLSTSCARGGGSEPAVLGMDAGERIGMDDGGAADVGAARAEDGGGECSPRCGTGERCMAGVCIADRDRDGVPSATDCDDADPRVGSRVTEACSTACGDGVRMCEDGEWSTCSSPSTCDCRAGEPPRQLSCGLCGTQTQVCDEGTWVDEGACRNEGACMPGEIDRGAPCGFCGMTTRTCGSDCRWSATSCEGEGVCAAAAVETEERPCVTGCGVERRTRTCSGACGWGAWTDWSECTARAACVPGATRPCSNGDPCGVETCDSGCNWGSCEPDTSMGSECLRIRPGTTGPLGNNFRCCTIDPTDDGWQFCLPTCRWSSECAPSTSC